MVRTRVLGRPPGILIFAHACKKLSPILGMIIRMMLLTVMMVIIMMKRIMRSGMITLTIMMLCLFSQTFSANQNKTSYLKFYSSA